MNILFIKHFFVGFVVSEIPRVSVFGYFPLFNSLRERCSSMRSQVDERLNDLVWRRQLEGDTITMC